MDDRLQRLIPPLLNEDDLDAQSDALDEFYELSGEGAFGVEDLIELIEMSVARQEDSVDEARSLLVFASELAQANGPDAGPAVDVIRRLMPRLQDEVKEAAFLVISSIPTLEAVLAYIEMLDEHGTDDMDVAPLAPEDFEDNPEVGGMLFPGVLRLAKTDRQRHMLLRMLLDFLEQEAIEPESLADYEEEFLAAFRAEIAFIREHQRESKAGQHAWKWDSPYFEHRDITGIMMEVIGWWGAEKLADALAECGDLTDPHLRLARAFSLLRAGRPVERDEMEWIASHPRERYWLHVKMTEMGLGHELPEICRDQEKLAEGHMVEWLSFPTELRREPDEIELVHVETRYSGAKKKGKPIDYYFFRFRVTENSSGDPEENEGWMVGMAGGYERTKGGTVLTEDAATWSDFTGWDEKPLEKHVAAFLDEPEDE
jgi:hypothetical protein